MILPPDNSNVLGSKPGPEEHPTLNAIAKTRTESSTAFTMDYPFRQTHPSRNHTRRADSFQADNWFICMIHLRDKHYEFYCPVRHTIIPRAQKLTGKPGLIGVRVPQASHE